MQNIFTYASLTMKPILKAAPKPNPAWKEWGRRFLAQLKAKESSVAKLSEDVGITEGGLRHWLNGTREINLSDFVFLCKKAGITPASVLFPSIEDANFLVVVEARNKTNNKGREHILVAADGALRHYGSKGSD